MSIQSKNEIQLEIAHVLFIDVVGYSKLSISDQQAAVEELTRIVRGSEQFQRAEAASRLTRIPTGDGMVLVFYTSPEAPVRCAVEISRALKQQPRLQLRMGIHSGPVGGVVDVNERANLAGAGINMAKRVMDCGDAGHILLSKHVAEDLEEYQKWRPLLHDLGSCEVKHGVRVSVVNLYDDQFGNAKLPQRFGTVQKRRRRLRRAATAAALLALVVVVAGIATFSRYRARSTLIAPKKSIAVLPFENLSDDKENAYFTEGVGEEILTDLAKIADLKVISRSSVMQYRNAVRRNLREIGEQLGVAHVLEGSVQRRGGRVRVSAQLIDARTDAHLWAEHYDRPLDDVFAIQSEVAQAIADQLNAKLSPAEKAAIKQRPTADLVAYDLYLRAEALRAPISFNARLKENLLEATRLLEQAIARDPTFFVAYCRLAEAHDLIYFFGSDHTPARLAIANTAIQTALRLRPDSGEAHLALAQHFYRGYREYEHALAELTLARHLLPNDSQVFELTGFITRRQGRWEESATDLERALELDPRNLFFLQQLSFTYQFQRRYRDLAAVLDRALKQVPSDSDTRVARASIDLEERADARPVHGTIEAVVAEDPAAAKTIADRWLYIALCERDNFGVSRALAVVPPEGISVGSNIWSPRAYFEAVAARARGDATVARAAFTAARGEVEKTTREQPDYAQGLTILGLIDAGLGRVDDAIREGRRAVELVPVSKDAIDGTDLILNLAVIYAWTGEKDLALKQLAEAAQLPSPLNYGWLRLHPDWDTLRGDPRFEKIVASLAPK
ncbi:MAG TPA: adenylate/guanylate cyclase domain-containing protein [Candidatus Dormibacteraeota bacterium]|nr:adenylate/guanylate cyclase domain-containing protein [Candidatus Dormibacteraeota bacterium]